MNYITKLPEREKNPETCCPSTKKGKSFINPWPSYNRSKLCPGYVAKNFIKRMCKPSLKKLPKENFVKIDVDLEAINNYHLDEGNKAIQLTWFGHASFLLQINKFNILFDPFLSYRASPIKFIGPYRYRKRGFKSFSELPPIDLIIISHNHYDHLDKATISEIFSKKKNEKAKIFCPLKVKKWFVNFGIPQKQIIECDWWDDYEVAHLPDDIEKKKKKKKNTKAKRSSNSSSNTTSTTNTDNNSNTISTDVNSDTNTNTNDSTLISQLSTQKITVSCVPCQHFSGRGLNDSDKYLWAGWVIKSPDVSYYFAGDTGYRSLPIGFDVEKIEEYPYCPVFKQIGNIHGPFDLASIPIGPIEPPSLMSPVHTNPYDAINIHLDVKSEHSIAMHWGTVANLGTLDVTAEPRILHRELDRRGIPQSKFHESYIGQVISIDKSKTIKNLQNAETVNKE